MARRWQVFAYPGDLGFAIDRVSAVEQVAAGVLQLQFRVSSVSRNVLDLRPGQGA